MRITLEQFCEQWAPKGNGRYLPNKMEFNTHDFVTKAGEYSISRFRTSFAEGVFTAAASRGRNANPAGADASPIP